MGTIEDLNKMVMSLFPDAIPNADFEIEFNKNNFPILTYWKTEKLGPKHSITEIHSVYMRFAKRIEQLNPGEKFTDPIPELTKERERALLAKTQREEIPEVIAGDILKRVRRSQNNE